MTIDLRSGIKKARSIITGKLQATSRFAKGFAKNLRFFPHRKPEAQAERMPPRRMPEA
jgi:hypothetical protein